MPHFVYMLKSIKSKKMYTYVGYTINTKDRLLKHNTNKGAKRTRGNQWKIIYKKKFCSKSLALKYEYFLKNNRNLRSYIKITHG